MRDIVVTLIVFGSLPFIFKRPYIGVLMWVWISVMNPHSQGWGFATSFPFAAIIGGTTLVSLVLTRDKKDLPINAVTIVFLLFVGYMSITSLFAIHPDDVYTQWIKVYKIMAMTVVTLMLLKDRRQLELLIWVMVGSLGYYGVKGGLFTIRSGGGERVWGPDGTFIGGNNEIALALIMVIPMMYYLIQISQNRKVRIALTASIFLCVLASLGSYSRGAFLAITAMAGFLWLKSNKKLPLGLLMVATIPFILAFMPAQWFNRIDTINTYEEDGSAMGRINAWKMAFNLAKDRPFGGGFEIYDAYVFGKYAPVPADIHAAHSIYFQVMGEHGFGGLFLYVLLGFLTWRTGAWIVKHAAKTPELVWAKNLATMLQVSLLGFFVGGAFLSLTYFDVPYYLMAIMVVTKVIVARELRASVPATVRRAALPPSRAHALSHNAPANKNM